MTKTEVKRLLKETFNSINSDSLCPEKIVDMDIYRDVIDGNWMFRIITVSKYHTPYQYGGWIEESEMHYLQDRCGLLTLFRYGGIK